MSTVTRTTNPNGTYRYELDGEVIYKASKVLYTHVSHYTVAGATPVLFHKTQAAASKARGYNEWTKTGTDAIVDGDAAATVAQHALTIANLAAVLMEQGRLRVSTGLSSAAITTTLDIARGREATRAAGIALAHGHDRDIREAFKTSVPPVMAPVDENPIPDATPRVQALHAQGATMVASLNDAALSAAWASTEKPNRGSCCDECNDEGSVTIVRGWLMDEIETRLGAALFDEWLCDTDVQDGFSTPATGPYLARARKI